MFLALGKLGKVPNFPSNRQPKHIKQQDMKISMVSIRKMKLNSKALRAFALAGLITLGLSATSSVAQTTPDMPEMPDSSMTEPMTPEQIRQQHQQMLGQMQQRMGQMQQQLAQMSPEELQQHHQQMMSHMEQMMGQMDEMMGENSINGNNSQMSGNSEHHPQQ